MSRWGMLASAAVGVVLGLGAVTFYSARGWSYLSDDPAACVNCHVMRGVYEGWSRAPHHAVAVCNDCHTPHTLARKYLVKAENGWHHSKAFTLQDFHEPIRIRAKNSRVLEENCRRCHAPLVAALGTVDCVRCHRGVGHG